MDRKLVKVPTSVSILAKHKIRYVQEIEYTYEALRPAWLIIATLGSFGAVDMIICHRLENYSYS